MTPPLSDDDRRALGIDPSVEPVLLGDDRPTDDGVGRGFANPPRGAFDLAGLRVHFASHTPVEGFAAIAARLGAPEASVARADRLRGVYQLAPEGLAVDPLGDAGESDGCWYIDARRGRVLVRVRGRSGDCLLRFEGDVFQWFDLPAAAPADTPAVDAPSADALLGGFDAPAWLTAPLARAPREDPFAVFAAVGTVGRLWAPRGTTTSPADALARLMADDDPMARARRWADASAGDVRDAAARFACVEADALTDALDALPDALDDDRAAARALALQWLERRDDLASVARLLAPPSDAPLARALASLDRAATTHASLWRMLSPLRSPRLDALVWQEPDAWWGAPARAT